MIITSGRRTLAVAAGLVIASTALGLGVVATSSASITGESKVPYYCDTEVRPLEDPGLGTPVILVHGIGSAGDDFEFRQAGFDFRGVVNSSKKAKVVQSFDYGAANTQWVTHPEIGPRLAKTIVCAGRWSKLNGGPGKVVLVGRSMGGLAIRQAYAEYVDGEKAGSYYGKVITFGTPNLGADFAGGLFWQGPGYTAMDPNAQDWRRLPIYPKTLPVYAIAGRYGIVTKDTRSGTTVSVGNGDGYVSIRSALAVSQYTPKYGGGSTIIDCGRLFEIRRAGKWFGLEGIIQAYMGEDKSCHHDNQRGEKFANEVKKSIERYTEALPEPDVWVNPTMPPMPPYTSGA